MVFNLYYKFIEDLLDFCYYKKENHVKDSHCYYYDLTQMINYAILLQKYC